VDVDEVGPQASARRSDRRTWRLAGVLVVVLIVAAGLTIALLGGEGSSGGLSPAAQQFEAAYTAFHGQYDSRASRLTVHLGQAGDSPGDPTFMMAAGDAKALAADYQTYSAAVKAITMPATATAGQTRVVQAASAGDVLMTQAAAFFGKAGMTAALDADWPRIKTELAQAETATRSALGLGG
jgi:hypothetical protein